MSEAERTRSRVLHGCCPRCGEGELFSSWLQFAPACQRCGLDFRHHDIGDGGAYLTICLIGGLVTLLAALVEAFFSPPYWVHAVLWLPCTLIGSLLMLHYTKAWMFAAAYRNDRLGEEP